jgi:hypothetical protein
MTVFFLVGTPGLSQSPPNQSISSEYVEINFQDKQDTLSVLEKLIEHLKHGRKVGSRIVCCYRIAMNLDKPYQVLFENHLIDFCNCESAG